VAYDNNTDKVTFIKKTGSEISSNNYVVDISSLIDSTTKISSVLSDQDEFVVVRKFDDSSISPAITADETWTAWTLPNTSSSGSTMYSLSGTDVTFSQTAADYTWTTAQSGRSADVVLPSIASGDTIYILRKTFNLQKLVNWTTGSKITSSNLNLASDQMLFLHQEMMTMWQKFHSLNPSVGQPDGVCPLDSSGTISSAYIGATTLNNTTGDGLTGAGTAASPLAVDLVTNGGLEIASEKLQVEVINALDNTSTTKPLSANQGKTLSDTITNIGTAIVYKGTFDLANTIASTGIGTPSAGWTVGHSGGSITTHANWNSLTVTNGALIRYNGTAWEVAQSVSSVLADGTVPITGNQVVLTQTADVGEASDGTEKRVASVEYVEDAIINTKLSELSDVNVSVNGHATFTFSGGPDSDEDMDTSTITLVDGDGTTVVFEIDDGTDGSGDGVSGSNIPIINVDSSGSARAGQMGPGNLATSLVYWINQQSALNIAATNPAERQVTLIQGSGGTGSNTTITLSDASTWNDNCLVNVPATFTGGAAGTAAVAGHMVYFDGDTWEPLALKTTIPTGTVLTTADSIADLADVGAAASGSGDADKALVWDGDSWEPTSVAGFTATMVTCGGVGDGAADESSNVNTAMNDSNLGHQGNPGTNTLSVCEFRSR